MSIPFDAIPANILIPRARADTNPDRTVPRRLFVDTEFDENGSTIKLISIAVVAESGDAYYRRLADGWCPEDCNDWVKANVLPHLPAEDGDLCATRAQVADDLRAIFLADGQTPEVWGYFSDYDWVAICQLYGCMVDLPKGFPMYCLDLKQEMRRLGLNRDDLPPHEGTAHDALADARWHRSVWLTVRALERNRTVEQVEIDHIRAVLESVNGVRTHAAPLLGLDRRTLHRKIEKHKIDVPSGFDPAAVGRKNNRRRAAASVVG